MVNFYLCIQQHKQYNMMIHGSSHTCSATVNRVKQTYTVFPTTYQDWPAIV